MKSLLIKPPHSAISLQVNCALSWIIFTTSLLRWCQSFQTCYALQIASKSILTHIGNFIIGFWKFRIFPNFFRWQIYRKFTMTYILQNAGKLSTFTQSAPASHDAHFTCKIEMQKKSITCKRKCTFKADSAALICIIKHGPKNRGLEKRPFPSFNMVKWILSYKKLDSY